MGAEGEAIGTLPRTLEVKMICRNAKVFPKETTKTLLNQKRHGQEMVLSGWRHVCCKLCVTSQFLHASKKGSLLG